MSQAVPQAGLLSDSSVTGSDATGASATGPVAYADSEAFDAQLLGRLAAGPSSVTVEIQKAVDLARLPDRLERWLSAVKQTGGAVRASARSAGSGATGITVDVPVRLLDPRVDRAVVVAAREFDALIAYTRETGAVREVQFLRRRVSTVSDGSPIGPNPR